MPEKNKNQRDVSENQKKGLEVEKTNMNDMNFILEPASERNKKGLQSIKTVLVALTK